MRSIKSKYFRLRLCSVFLTSVIFICIFLSGPYSFGQTGSDDHLQRYDSVQVFQDSVIYTFCSNLTAWTQEHRIYPLHFRIRLPPNLLSTYASGMESFGFQYDNRQVIYVWLDYEDHTTADTTYYIHQEREIRPLLLKLDRINDDTKLCIDDNPYDPSRETRIIKRGKATILLYNINKEDSTLFFNYATSFTFLRS
jgi:hypothetical protein